VKYTPTLARTRIELHFVCTHSVELPAIKTRPETIWRAHKKISRQGALFARVCVHLQLMQAGKKNPFRTNAIICDGNSLLNMLLYQELCFWEVMPVGLENENLSSCMLQTLGNKRSCYQVEH
jgi:hypothetical protein